MTVATAIRHVHGAEPVLKAGSATDQATGALVLVHGRGGSARDILSLADALPVEGLALRAPHAHGHTWYPYGFMAPMSQNQPGLDSALQKLDEVARELNDAGIADRDIHWLGFSQGACLTLEHVARQGRRWGGVVAFSGGLIGPEGTARDYPGLDGTPVFIGCSDVDFHIPVGRVRESAEVFRRLGAEVDLRIYPGMGHTIVPDEIEAASAILESGRRRSN